ncbi:MAG TPA: hypothetical protein VM532_06435 [Burkholderiales bacterium]|jgi:hypothetical protein|nr:hypothetical protein [Burkholderiales bacterium]
MSTEENNKAEPHAERSISQKGQAESLLKRVNSLHQTVPEKTPNQGYDQLEKNKSYQEWAFEYFDLHAEIEAAFHQLTQQELEVADISAKGDHKDKEPAPESDEQDDPLDDALYILDVKVKKQLFDGMGARLDRWKAEWKKERSTQGEAPQEDINVLRARFTQAKKHLDSARMRAQTLREEMQSSSLGEPHEPGGASVKQNLTKVEMDGRKRERRILEFRDGVQIGQIVKNEVAFEEAESQLRTAIHARLDEIDRQLNSSELLPSEESSLKREQDLLADQGHELLKASWEEVWDRIMHRQSQLEFLRTQLPLLRQELREYREPFLQESANLRQWNEEAEERRLLRMELREMEQEAVKQIGVLERRITQYDKYHSISAQQKAALKEMQSSEMSARRDDGWTEERPKRLWSELTQLRDRRKQMLQQLRSEEEPKRREELEEALVNVMREESAEFKAELDMHNSLREPDIGKLLEGRSREIFSTLEKEIPSLLQDWMETLSLQRLRIQKAAPGSDKDAQLKRLQGMFTELSHAMHVIHTLSKDPVISTIDFMAKLREERRAARVGLRQLVMPPEARAAPVASTFSFLQSTLQSTFQWKQKEKKLSTSIAEQATFLKGWCEEFQRVLQEHKDIIDHSVLPEKAKASRYEVIQSMERELGEHKVDQSWLERNSKYAFLKVTDNGRVEQQFIRERGQFEQRLNWEKKRVLRWKSYLDGLRERSAKRDTKEPPKENFQPAESATTSRKWTSPDGELTDECMKDICRRMGATTMEEVTARADIVFLAPKGGKVEGDPFFEERASDSVIYHFVGHKEGDRNKIIVVGFSQLLDCGLTRDQVRGQLKKQKGINYPAVRLEMRRGSYQPGDSFDVKAVEKIQAKSSAENQRPRSPSPKR